MPDSSKPPHNYGACPKRREKAIGLKNRRLSRRTKRRTKYAVETQMLNTWENCWRDENDEPELFPTRREAEREIRELIADSVEAVKDGYLEDALDRSEFRVVKVRG